MIIPERFQKHVSAHLMGNFLNIEHFPLILAIMGEPGMGKTWQLREHLKALDVDCLSVSSADLESENAGVPAKLLKDQYIKASINIAQKHPSAIVIDDIDTTVGEWENNTGTVNHQGILAFLMHIADNPNYIEGSGKLERVPIFFTGNNFNLLYEPLRRPGRTRRFDWKPTKEERVEIVGEIFGLSDKSFANQIVESFPNSSVAFFADFYTSKCIEELNGFVSNAGLKCIFNDIDYKNKVTQKYYDSLKDVDWVKYITERSEK